MYKLEDIKEVHLEITQNCQASCPMCDRNENGGAVNKYLDMSELTYKDCVKMFDSSFIKQLRGLQICGNHGDPIVAKDTLEIIQYFRQHNDQLWINMNTNAGARDEAWWSDLAHVLGRMGSVIFSVDGLRDTNHIYRQGVNWDSVERSMRAFISAGGRARWDFLVFDYNEHQTEKAEAFANELGFEQFRLKKSSRFITGLTSNPKLQHQAVNRKGKETALLKKPKNEKLQNKELNKQSALLETFGSMDNFYDVSEISCRVKDIGSIYISAEGLALPCCWTAGRMYKWWHHKLKQDSIWDFIDAAGGKDAINAKKSSLESVFKTGIFDNIEKSWQIDGVNNGRLKVCAMKCSKEFDVVNSQWK